MTKKSLVIQNHIVKNDCLFPVIFDTEEKMFSTVREGLLKIANFRWNDFSKVFDDFKLHDIIVYGDLVTYLYNQYNEVSIGFVVDASKDTLPYLDDINTCFVRNELPYKFINRSVHCRCLTCIDEGMPCYSLKNDEWIYKPQKKELPFSYSEFVKGFTEYQKKFHSFVEKLPQHENKLLTLEGSKLLEQHLKQQKYNSQNIYAKNKEHEYNLEYLYYRTFKEMGGENYFHTLVMNSYNYNINVLEEC